MSIDLLGPLSIPLFPKYPARHVLCFDNKYSEPGDEYVVNLRDSTTASQVDIVKGLVTWFRQKSVGNSGHLGFTDISLVSGRAGLYEKDEYDYAEHA